MLTFTFKNHLFLLALACNLSVLKSSNLGKKFLSDYLELGLELKFVA